MEPNEPDDEVTSDYEESVAPSEFTSVDTARLLQSHYERGRRYQGLLRDRYGLPNDDAEQFREGLKHKLYVDYLLHGKLIIAPIGDYPQKIVDLGTGAGFWAQDVGEAYPSARVIGTDISPIQPHWTPPNVEFHVEDLEDELRPWTSIYAGADLIHIRAMLQTVRAPKSLLNRAFHNIKPGGWIECHETIPLIFSHDGSVTSDHPMNKIYGLVEEHFARIWGWNIRFPHKLAEALAEAGFENIQEQRTEVPIGSWHRESRMREMGLFCQSITEDWILTLVSRPDTLGLSEEEASRMGKAILDTFEDDSCQTTITFLECWAQKPWE